MLIIASVLPNQGFGQSDSLVCCHECCCEMDPTPAGMMISHIHKKGQWMFSYRFMNMNMGDMQVGTDKVSDESIFSKYLMSSGRMYMNMHMLMGMYGLTNRLTLMGMLHYNTVSMDMKMMPGTTHVHNGVVMGNEMDMRMKTNGLSDAKLHALYGLINEKRHHLLVSAGVNIPLGSVDRKGGSSSMYPDQRFPYAMQLGSGTWDILPGVSYMFQKGIFTWSSQVTAVIRTGQNRIGYRLGDEVTTNHWAAFSWAKNFSSSLRFEGSIMDNIRGQDASLYAGNEPAANPYNYGGKRVSGFVGTNFHFRKGFLTGNRIGVEYGIPFYQDLFGPQMGMKSSLYASWSLSL